jgi:hypothetical protein
MVSALVILFNFSKASYDEKVTALPSCRITDFRHFGNALTLPAIGSDKVVFKQTVDNLPTKILHGDKEQLQGQLGQIDFGKFR